MPITKENVLQHELIGLKVEVVESRNPDLEGKKGKIVDETRKTLKIEEEGDLKTLPKKSVTLLVHIPEGEKVKVKGIELVARPEDRTKKCG